VISSDWKKGNPVYSVQVLRATPSKESKMQKPGLLRGVKIRVEHVIRGCSRVRSALRRMDRTIAARAKKARQVAVYTFDVSAVGRDRAFARVTHMGLWRPGQRPCSAAKAAKGATSGGCTAPGKKHGGCAPGRHQPGGCGGCTVKPRVPGPCESAK
jgi:hypothetical protein